MLWNSDNLNWTIKFIDTFTSIIIAYIAYQALNTYKKSFSKEYLNFEIIIIRNFEKIISHIKLHDLYNNICKFENLYILMGANIDDQQRCKQIVDSLARQHLELKDMYETLLPTLKEDVFKLDVLHKSNRSLIAIFDKSENILIQYSCCMGDAIYALYNLIDPAAMQSKYYKNNKIILDIEKERIKNINQQISKCNKLIIKHLHNNRI